MILRALYMILNNILIMNHFESITHFEKMNKFLQINNLKKRLINILKNKSIINYQLKQLKLKIWDLVTFLNEKIKMCFFLGLFADDKWNKYDIAFSINLNRIMTNNNTCFD